jgi:hypothetical protein
MSSRTFSLKYTILPGNSAYVVPWDSTRGIEGIVYASEASNPAPGPKRGRYDGKLIRYTLKVGGFDVSLDEQVLDGVAGTNADWNTQTATVTVAAGTTVTREFKPFSPDHRILITAGASAPTTLVFKGTILDCADFGN